MGTTTIEWTRGDDGAMGKTWNPVRGCSRVDPDCENCYAEAVAGRFCGPGLPYEGLAVRKLKVLQDGTERLESRWTRVVRLVPEHLADPIRWKRPRRVFVNSMSDLFHEKLTNEEIDQVFAVMAVSSRHTFQVLTKRPARAREYLVSRSRSVEFWEKAARELGWTLKFDNPLTGETLGLCPFPLPNVWLGTSVGHQGAAHRIDALRGCPAVVRFVSFEPLHGPVRADLTGVHWGIIGGESGPRARPFDVRWGRDVQADLRAAGAAVFWKQLGSRPVMPCARCGGKGYHYGFGEGGHDPDWCSECGGPGEDWPALRDKKGGDPAEWPADIRVREFPR